MEKLVERESAARRPLVAAPALAVQFFLIPLVVVSVAVGVYVGFRSLMVDSRTGKRRNLGTFATREAGEKHERAVQFFKRRGG